MPVIFTVPEELLSIPALVEPVPPSDIPTRLIIPVEELVTPGEFPNGPPFALPIIFTVPDEELLNPIIPNVVVEAEILPTIVQKLGEADKNVKHIVEPASTLADKEIALLILNAPPARPPALVVVLIKLT
jgi:hypothetical protein